MVKHHQFTILRGIRLPSRQAVNIGIARMSKLRPRTAHQIGQTQIVGSRLWHDVLGLVQAVEAETEFVAVDGAEADGRAPSEHIQIEVRDEG